MNNIFKQNRPYARTELSYVADIEIKTFQDALVSFISLVKCRPDGAVLQKLTSLHFRSIQLQKQQMV